MATTNVTAGVDGLVGSSNGTDYETATGTAGNISIHTTNSVAFVKAGSNFFCRRTYFRFDTTGIATDQVASTGNISVTISAARGTTDDEMEVMKFFNSTDHTTAFSANTFGTGGASVLFQTVGDAVSDEVDVGQSGASTFTLDSTGLAYINTQMAAGNQCAFLVRCQGDFSAGEAGIAEPTAINTRGFRDFEESNAALHPKLTITHDVAGFGHAVIGVASGVIGSVNAVATANIGKVIGVD